MPAPVSSKVPRRAPKLWNPKRPGWGMKECQRRSQNGTRDDSETLWGQDIVCPNIHVRPGSFSSWVFLGWEFVTTVENAKRNKTLLWIEEGSRDGYIFPWMLSWDLFQDSIKKARGGSFPEDLVLRLPCVDEPLKAGTEIEWRMSMTAAEFLVSSDHRMWCREKAPIMVVCRAKEFRTLVDQGWTALMRELKEGETGDANGEAQSKGSESDSTTDSNAGQGHQGKDGSSSTDDVAEATVGDDDGDPETETTTTTTTIVNWNPTATTTTTTKVDSPTTTTSTTIVTTVAGGCTTTNTTTTKTSTKRKNIAQAKSRDGGNNKRPRGSTAQAEQNTASIDLEQEK